MVFQSTPSPALPAVQNRYFLKLASHASRTGRLLGSIVMKAIPIPEVGRE
jgi:hypothetical protein